MRDHEKSKTADSWTSADAAKSGQSDRVDLYEQNRAAFLCRRRRKNWIVALSLFSFCAAVFAWFLSRTITTHYSVAAHRLDAPLQPVLPTGPTIQTTKTS